MNSTALSGGLDFLDNWLAFRAQKVDIPGFSVAVYHDDDVVFSKAYGLANIESEEALTAQHQFCVASQSKMFTATAVLQLVESGDLRLDDPAVQHLSWLQEHQDNRFRDITIRQLLSHSSGMMRDGQAADFWQYEQPFPDVQALQQLVLDSRLAFEPNTTLKYSNLGYALLGQIIEAASGQSFDEYVTQNIIKPLKLANTSVEWRADATQATGYTPPVKGVRTLHDQRHIDKLSFESVTGMYSTPEDMCRFMAGHFLGNGLLMSDTIKREAQRNHWTITNGYDGGLAWGLGFEARLVDGQRFIGHGGGIAGYASCTLFSADKKLAVSVAANSKEAAVYPILYGVLEALLYFEAHGSTATAPDKKRFNIHLFNPVASLQVVATDDQAVMIEPDDWEPFTWAETLAYSEHDADSLYVDMPGSVFGDREPLEFHFDNGGVAAVKYAGLHFYPKVVLQKMADKKRT